MKKIKLFHYYFLISIFACSCHSLSDKTKELSDAEIAAIIDQHKPSKGYQIPDNFSTRIGATHVDGKYYFTGEPYIIEGCRTLQQMGYGVVKLWFNKGKKQGKITKIDGYSYNSEWQLPDNCTLKDLAQNTYYKTCFDMNFSTIVLSIGGAGVKTTNESSQKEEQEIYELTQYLLDEYKDREMTFILENWEGDWIMRGGTGDSARWSRKAGELIKAVDGDRYTVLVPADSTQRVQNMVKWFTARQRGVERARQENVNSKCKVYHAIEANKVIDSMNGIPGIINSVLPNVNVDMVSWSCYDALNTTGLDNGILLYKGIEYIKKYFTPSNIMKGEKRVFLGEIGIPEQRYEELLTEEPVIKNWDTYVAVCLALNIPYLIQWELYCNEPKDEAFRSSNGTRTNDEMRGFWLIRPDGTKSFAAKYFDSLLKNQGQSLK